MNSLRGPPPPPPPSELDLRQTATWRGNLGEGGGGGAKLPLPPSQPPIYLPAGRNAAPIQISEPRRITLRSLSLLAPSPRYHRPHHRASSRGEQQRVVGGVPLLAPGATGKITPGSSSAEQSMKPLSPPRAPPNRNAITREARISYDFLIPHPPPPLRSPLPFPIRLPISSSFARHYPGSISCKSRVGGFGGGGPRIHIEIKPPDRGPPTRLEIMTARSTCCLMLLLKCCSARPPSTQVCITDENLKSLFRRTAQTSCRSASSSSLQTHFLAPFFSWLSGRAGPDSRPFNFDPHLILTPSSLGLPLFFPSQSRRFPILHFFRRNFDSSTHCWQSTVVFNLITVPSFELLHLFYSKN